MDISRLGIIGSIQYKPPVAQATGLTPSQRLEGLKPTEKTDTQNQYGSGSVDPTAIPVAREQYLYGLNPFAKPVDSDFKVEPGALSKKYGAGSISFGNSQEIKGNFQNGLSPMKLGALGEDAIISGSGRVGGTLNIRA